MRAPRFVPVANDAAALADPGGEGPACVYPDQSADLISGAGLWAGGPLRSIFLRMLRKDFSIR